MEKRLISKELENLFVELISTTSDMYLRDRFDYVGLKTNEILEVSAHPSGHRVMEQYKSDQVVKLYFENVDWCLEEDVGKVLRLVRNSLRKINEHYPSGIYNRVLILGKKEGVLK